MKLFRGSRQGDDMHLTDEKAPEAYIKKWEPNKKIWFNATIKESPTRGAMAGVSIDEEDVFSLLNGIFTHYKKNIDQLNLIIASLKEELKSKDQEMAEKDQEIENLQEAFRRLHWLSTIHIDKAPCDKDFIETVALISDHFTFNTNIEETCLRINWIDWNKICPSDV